MSLKTYIQNSQDWTKNEQIAFCNKISQNITIAIRSIACCPDKNNEVKLEAIKMINEFHHQINNIKFELKNNINIQDQILRIGKQATFYAKQNEVLRDELAFVLSHSFENIQNMNVNNI